MKLKALLVALFVAGLAASVAIAGPPAGIVKKKPPKAGKNAGKVAVCHRTKSKKKPWVTIRVSPKAVKGHLRHGDAEGACSTVTSTVTVTVPGPTTTVTVPCTTTTTTSTSTTASTSTSTTTTTTTTSSTTTSTSTSNSTSTSTTAS